jgi:single-strand DNA-binding protein
MAGINKVILIGNVGTDPEVRNLEGGNVKAKFRLATTENHRDKDGTRIEHTEWHNIIAWKGLAEIVGKYIKKGSQVYIEGKLRTRQWEDKDGNKKQTTEIVAETITLLGLRKDHSNSSSQDMGNIGNNPGPSESGYNYNDFSGSGDLPF